jgi:hypothetical protein
VPPPRSSSHNESVWSFLTCQGLSELRSEALDHVTQARRQGQRDPAWEAALTRLEVALDATEQLAHDLEPTRLGRRNWQARR